MAKLNGKNALVVSKHLKKIFSSGELDENSVCAKYAQTADDGKNYNYKFYSLAAIIAVGYRTNSDKATQFRQWATKVLDAFTKQGYVIQNWMRAKSTISFIGLWERLHNDDFNCLEFEAIKNEAGENDFVMTPNCIMNTSRRTKLLEPHTTLFHRNFHNTQRSSQIVDGLPPNINPLIKGDLT